MEVTAISWTAPRTWVASEIVTAALMNTHVRDNLLETAPAKAATAGYFIRVTGANAIEEADPTDGAKLDGDHLDIDFTPTNYTPSTAPAEAADVDDLAAHLAGIDDELATVAKQSISIKPDEGDAGATGFTFLDFGDYATIRFDSGSTDAACHITLTLPSSFNNLTKAVVRCSEATGGSLVFRYNVKTDFAADGEVVTANSDSIAATDKTMPATASEMEEIDISAAFTGIAAGDSIGVEFYRETSHANDTAGDIYVYDFLFEWN